MAETETTQKKPRKKRRPFDPLRDKRPGPIGKHTLARAQKDAELEASYSAVNPENIAFSYLKGFCGFTHPHEMPVKHQEILISQLQLIEKGPDHGGIPNLMVLMPPGGAKSTYCSVDFPCWYLGRNPKKLLIAASFGQELVDGFGKKCRNICAEPWYDDIFHTTLTKDSTAKHKWALTNDAEYFATSVGGAITGKRADCVVIDDPVKGQEEADSLLIRDRTWEWYLSDVLTRLKPGGTKIIVQTRWHEDDLSGRILGDKYKGRSGIYTAYNGEKWVVMVIQAQATEYDILKRPIGEFFWPEYFPAKMLETMKRTARPRVWAALYQQLPAPEEGDYFHAEDIQYYEPGELPKDLRLYGASDYAVADDRDWTVHGVAGLSASDDLYILDWWRRKTSSDKWILQLIKMMQTHKTHAWAEEKGQIRRSLEPFIRKSLRDARVYNRRVGYPSTTNKQERAQSIAGRVSQRKVYLPKRASWTADLVQEMLTFPTGTNDDQVDVLSLFGRMLDKMRPLHVEATTPEATITTRAPTINELIAFNREKNRVGCNEVRIR